MPETTGLGAKFKWNETEITNIATIVPPDDELEMADLNQLDPEDGFQKSIPTIFKGGEATVTVNWDPTDASHIALRTAKNSKTKGACTITFPGGRTCTFQGYVTHFPISEISASDVLQAEATIKVVSKPIWS